MNALLADFKLSDPMKAAHPGLNEERLMALYGLLCQANQTMNLTRIEGAAEFMSRHIEDSLTLCTYLGADFSGKLLDIGSGAGFPAFPLALAYPKATIVAVESVKKKARFIQEAVEALGLNNIKAVAERCELLAHLPQYRSQYDIVTARAVSKLSVLAELSLPFLRPSGLFIAMKTTDALETELPQAFNAIALCGGCIETVQVEDVSTETLPNRKLIIIRKQGQTPERYPRMSGTPQKSPL
jgi:16S rRNA (guanine527-N7)-methyltransferase